MRVEHTHDRANLPRAGFEDREDHRIPCASVSDYKRDDGQSQTVTGCRLRVAADWARGKEGASDSFVMVVQAKDRRTRIVHLAVGYALLLAAIWTTRPAQLWLSLAAAVWIVYSVVHCARDASELGLRVRGFRRAAWVIAVSVAVALAMMGVALLLGTLHPLFGLLPQVPHSVLYAFWALQQEFILQCFFFVELEALLGKSRAVVAAAMLFSLAHLPNPLLTVATLGMGLFFAAAFARDRNLYALAIAHAILGLSFALSVPDDLHRHMRVGIGYLLYKPSATSVR